MTSRCIQKTLIQSFENLLYDETNAVLHENWKNLYKSLNIQHEKKFELPETPEKEGESAEPLKVEKVIDPAMETVRMVNNVHFESFVEKTKNNLGKIVYIFVSFFNFFLIL